MSIKPFPYQPYALGHITAANQNIGSISNTNGQPVQFTLTNHGYLDGQYIRIAGITGQTALNGDWTLSYIDTNTFGLKSGTGLTPAAAPLGNGTASSGGTVARTPLPITLNHPEFAGLGIGCQALTIQPFSGNIGNIYFGAIIPGIAYLTRTTPFTDTLYILKPTVLTPQNVPIFSPGNSNIIYIDTFWVDFDSIGDGVLISAFQR